MTISPTYVGSPDFHDGCIRETTQRENGFEVIIEGCSGRRHRLLFQEPRSVDRTDEVGMMLYGLTQTPDEVPELRTYTFLNWDEGDQRRQLIIVARSFDWESIE